MRSKRAGRGKEGGRGEGRGERGEEMRNIVTHGACWQVRGSNVQHPSVPTVVAVLRCVALMNDSVGQTTLQVKVSLAWGEAKQHNRVQK